ncbi:MAG: 30S ribosomal protein S20 [Parcubacteria group bacterium GW2011_GWA2_43_9b]|nr:MAG: 30S ribosomal protein S20 [Parcubacteria group bacterium GW2011_GWA2_43_9b]
MNIAEFLLPGMPIKESAKKELRKAKKRRVLNVRRQKTMKDALKNIKKLILSGKADLSSGKKDEAKKMLSIAYQAIDKAAKRGVIKKNAAARKKSRLMKAINK